MPRPPEWVTRIPGIREALERDPDLRLNWMDIARMFGVERRQGFRLIDKMRPNDKPAIVSAGDVLRFLDSIETSPDVARILHRMERVGEQIGKAQENWQARHVEIPAARRDEFVRLDDLEGVSFAPGLLQIEHAGAEDLLTRLFGLSQAMASDLERFQELAVPATPKKPQSA